MCFIILYFLLLNEIFSYITFQLYEYKDIVKEANIDYISEYIIYTNLQIGFPPQKITALILPNESSLTIEGNKCNIKSNFELEKSTTYNAKDYSKQFMTNITLSYLITDKFEFIFNETNQRIFIGPITYLYSPNNHSKINNHLYPCANIGFTTTKYDFYEPTENIILQLKNLNVIKKYCFFIIYNKIENNEGKLIIGEYPDIYNPEEYKNYQLKTIYSLNINDNYNWQLKFTSIYFEIKDIKISFDSLNSKLDISSNLIFSPEEYFNKIISMFFEEKINKGLCSINISKKNIKYIICNSSNFIKSFPVLYFKQSFLIYTFELNYNDVFYKVSDEKYIFLICYHKEFKTDWKLGNPFLRKYLFFYNYDEKFLGFYNPKLDKEGNLINNNHQNNEINKNKNNNRYLIIIFLIILSFLIFGIFFILSKKYFIKRKKRKNIQNKTLIREMIFTNEDDENNN